MSHVDLSDDDNLRFVQRVLESGEPQAGRALAREMIVAMRTRVRSDQVTNVCPTCGVNKSSTLSSATAMVRETMQLRTEVRQLRVELAAANRAASQRCEAITLRDAIEAMRIAGGSVEFQAAFERAKSLIANGGNHG